MRPAKKHKKYPRERTFYEQNPDYTRPVYQMPPQIRERMLGRLKSLYGEKLAGRCMPELERILRVHYAHKSIRMLEKEGQYDPKERFSEKDMILITYGDIVKGEGDTPLSVLHNFVNTYNQGAINTIHILPFFPYSSDRGFAVVDFRQVDPKLGTWEDIQEKKRRYDLMFDAVLNHVSSRSEMFREFRNGNPRYREFFVVYDSPDDLTPEQRKKIFRPRTSDILTRSDTINGPKWVWTTFSDDQIDLNYRNPEVLMQVVNSVLFYIRHGADILRLDAVTYIWAEPGTEGIRLPETHEIVKLLRDVVEAVGSGVALITETNIPHEDNVSYFGNGYDEAHMVYNFALPPLVLHAFYKEDATALSRWAARLEPPSEQTIFFNILDTHDGVGLMGVKNILPQEEIDHIIRQAEVHGARISYRKTQGQTPDPYEINTTWWSAINDDKSGEEMRLQVKRYLASRSISLVLKGVPGVYVHGALGSSNDYDRAGKTGVNRDLNRGIIDSAAVEWDLRDPESKLSLIRRYGGKADLIRTQDRAFHPRGRQRILAISSDVFAVLRVSPEEDGHILALINVTGRESRLEVPLGEIGVEEDHWHDLLGEKRWVGKNGTLEITLWPYDVLWLKPASEVEGTGWL